MRCKLCDLMGLYSSDLDDWDESTINKLIEHNHSEDDYIEYKSVQNAKMVKSISIIK